MRLWLSLLALGSLSAAERFDSQSMDTRPGIVETAGIEFRAMGLYWTGGGEVRVRASRNGSQWTAWLAAHAEAEANGETASALVYFGEPLRSFEVEGAAARYKVLLIDAGETPAGKLGRLGKLQERSTQPPVVSRAEWGCTTETCPSPAAPAYTSVTHLVVHHSAGANVSNDWPAVVRSIWVLHVRGNGWNDIGYNYLIDPNGVLYEGRAGGDGVLGAHFSGVNSGTMGVCMMGTYSTVASTPESLATLRALLSWQAAKWRIDPGGRSLHAASGLMINNISGHRDAGLSPRATSTTECPGNGLYTALPQLRRQVRDLVEAGCQIAMDRPFRCSGAAEETIEVSVRAPDGCPLNVESRASWINAELAGGVLRIRVASNAGEAREGAIAINGQSILVAQAAAGGRTPPCLDFTGVVSAAGFDPRPAVPGALVSLLGTRLASQQAQSDAWPTELGGVKVQINGRDARVAYVSPTQINAQVPAATNIGSARITVNADGVASPERLFWVSEAVPAIFLAQNPVRAGEIVNVYLTGAGRAGLPWSVSLGEAVSLNPLPELLGVHLARLRLPANLAAGEHELTLRIAGVESAPVRLIVESP
jgi:uncharacterized protein (TIGR03437 family)